MVGRLLRRHGLVGEQELLDKPQALFCLVLSPTRELAIQIGEQFEALGSTIGVKCAALVGGVDMMAQAIALAKRPHIIVGTPGRVVDHLANTKVGTATGKERWECSSDSRHVMPDCPPHVVTPSVVTPHPTSTFCGGMLNAHLRRPHLTPHCTHDRASACGHCGTSSWTRRTAC